MTDNKIETKASRGWLALSPLGVFLCLYLATSLVLGDFYAMPITVAFLISAIYAVLITRGTNLAGRVELFSRGAGNIGVMQMIWIFVLAGAFAASAGAIGSIDATVEMVLAVMPERLLPVGIFVGACFISFSIGTSVGTIVALAPIVVGISSGIGANPALMTAIVVGGAFFGDNLSFISDTTIAATRTQGCAMRDKFRTNLAIVLPAAISTAIIYLIYGFEVSGSGVEATLTWSGLVKIIPYIIVIGTALGGVNVCIVLTLGIASTGIIGLIDGSITPIDWCGSMGEGITGMGELIIVTLLAGGMLELIRYNGGIAFMLRALTRRVRSRRGAEASIAALVSIANVCTANNTIAIITVGPLAADISRRFGVDPRRSASLLDTFSCVVQGVLPYGAQLLMASSLTGLSPLDIIGYLYYPMALLVFAAGSIVFGYWVGTKKEEEALVPSAGGKGDA